MKYYKLLYDYENSDDVMISVAGDLIGIDRYDVEKGIEVNHWGDRITFTCDSSSGSRLTDYLATDLSWFVISPKFRKALEENGIKGIQYLPVNVVMDADGRRLDGYSVANIVNLLDALDLQHSKYVEQTREDGSQWISVHVYALKTDVIAGYDIFRLKGKHFSIFISDKVRRIIKKSGITGCDFGNVRLA